MIFCICFCHVKGSPGGDRAPSVFLLMLLALSPARSRSPPEFCRNSRAGGAPPRHGPAWAAPPLGSWARPGTGSLGWERTLGKGPPWSGASWLHAHAPKSERASQQNAQAATKSSENRPSAEAERGPREWGAHRGDAVRSPRHHGFRLRVPAQPVAVCSFTYLRLVLIVYTALCFCRLNVCSSHQSLPATHVLFGQEM